MYRVQKFVSLSVFFLLLKAQELWGEKSTVRFRCSPVCSCRGKFFFSLRVHCGESISLSRRRNVGFLFFPRKAAYYYYCPLYIERVTPSSFFFFPLPYLSPVWERPRELGTATVHPCIWRAARLGLDCVGLVNSARKKIVMQCLCL